MTFLEKIQEILKPTPAAQAPAAKTTQAAPQNTDTSASATSNASSGASAFETSVQPYESTYSSQDESIYTQVNDKPEATKNGFENTSGLSKEEINEKDRAWRDEKEALGLKTTNINYNNGETTFAEYFAALDPEVKEMLTSYFDDDAVNKAEAEKAISEIAGIFQNTNVVKNQQFVNAVRALGYEVEWGSVKTDYIIDFKNKKAGGGSLREGGTLTMLTIKNKAGEELFKMVDANGNGSIEMEELFFNEFLTGISSQIDKELMVAGLKAFQATYDDMVESDGSLTDTQDSLIKAEKSGDKDENGKTILDGAMLKQMLESKTEAGATVGEAVASIKKTYAIDKDGEKIIKEFKAEHKEEVAKENATEDKNEVNEVQEETVALELEEKEDEEALEMAA